MHFTKKAQGSLKGDFNKFECILPLCLWHLKVHYEHESLWKELCQILPVKKNY